MNLKKTSNFMLVVLTFALLGCTADPYNRGNYVDIAEIKGKEGVWTRKDVEQTIGSPSFADPQNSNVVYYVGAQGHKYPFVSPTIHKAATIQLEYDAQGKLRKITEIE
ncbi:MAG: outer membrane protein assembly factor BamE [Alphaproteobacteria bacterium]|nr:outer membrane protein assembly factor BamE [Alphaproteobacteria bacterium]